MPASETPILQPRSVVALACLCAAAGLLTIFNSVQMLWAIWRTDELKSMGMVVPFVCAALILREWRRLGWETEGSWWGFAVLALSAALMFLRDQTLFIVTINRDWLLQIPPLPLVAVVYAGGMVLLFGGRRLLRAAWFPVLLMWAVIPVPQTFSRFIDLPLQHAAATVARAFAHALGQPLTQDKLRLMFTPQFGMFIAPGCNGIRGAITLGLAAIVVAYLYRFRWYVFAPVVAGAVLLGYVFNFLRLCLLVVYYKIALPHPWLQNHAKRADYIIGGCLFVLALVIFFAVADRLRHDPQDVRPASPAQALAAPSIPPRRARPFLLRVAAVLALSAVFGAEAIHTLRVNAAYDATRPTPAGLPAHIGDYTLVRTWRDTLVEGTVVYLWGEYAAPAPATGPAPLQVSLGISPELGVHDAEVCHIARGEEPTWHGQIVAPSPGGEIDLTGAAYNDGVTQRLEASTVCDAGACRQYSETTQHITLLYARPHRELPMQSDRTRSVPVLLKVESLDVTSPTSVVEPQLAATLRSFLAQANLVQITAPYSVH
ncbi:MAG TPA: exosortase J [Acidobacteriaceae bacterium]|nr:exosortase J [Acidobacteriaceae bacterium]